MNVESNDWQVVGSTVYRLFTDANGERCNEFTIQVSSSYEIPHKEDDTLAKKVCNLLNLAELAGKVL